MYKDLSLVASTGNEIPIDVIGIALSILKLIKSQYDFVIFFLQKNPKNTRYMSILCYWIRDFLDFFYKTIEPILSSSNERVIYNKKL